MEAAAGSEYLSLSYTELAQQSFLSGDSTQKLPVFSESQTTGAHLCSDTDVVITQVVHAVV